MAANRRWTLPLRRSLALLAIASVVFIGKTWIDLQSFPDRLVPEPGSAHVAQYLDRNGARLNVTLQNQWNYHDYQPLHEMPPLLLKAFVHAEDKRFFEHHGIDWRARIHAVSQNLQAGRVVRGASTITEQVVRLLHPRPRTFWSRWLEGWEANALEQRFSKAEILEFYLNQVPYARQRRGVVQASHFYFDRALNTLNSKELLALAVLVRAPGRLDPVNNRDGVNEPIERLADILAAAHVLDGAERRLIATGQLELARPKLGIDAAHYIVHLKSIDALEPSSSGNIVTTLDSSLQQRVNSILENRIRALRRYDVSDGAVLVVDHLANEVLAWANAGSFSNAKEGSQIDAITMARQPGSTLKPFLYALAMEKGWTAATLIDDSPLTIAVGNGLHSVSNYSHSYYGPIRLREALGNSLNVPAIRAAGFVGRDHFLRRLRVLGFETLIQHPDFYGDGIGLGNGEVSLFELVRAYGVLARGGQSAPLKFAYRQSRQPFLRKRIYSREIVSLISDILSDPDARTREFGRGSVLNFPIQTAVKTGTSTDYRDAWAVGYSHRYTVGVWMGNLDQKPMKEITGSTGPGMVLRAVFNELHKNTVSSALYKSRRLRAVNICPVSGLRASKNGPSATEWFRPGKEPREFCNGQHGDASLHASVATDQAGVRISQPISGMQLAMDPRIPDRLERLPLEIDSNALVDRVQWTVNGRLVGSAKRGELYLWPMQRGFHTVSARVWLAGKGDRAQDTGAVKFLVK